MSKKRIVITALIIWMILSVKYFFRPLLSGKIPDDWGFISTFLIFPAIALSISLIIEKRKSKKHKLIEPED
jgi:hypothetical protein